MTSASLIAGASRATVTLFTLSLAAWVALAACVRADYPELRICSGVGGSSVAVALANLRLQWALNGGAHVVLSLTLMVIAMTVPTLSGPVLHLWHRSLARHRCRAITLFAAAFLLVWIMTCGALVVLAQLAKGLFGGGGTPFFVGCGVAMLWQISPAKQASLQRCHLRPPLSAFGLRALLDPLVFGTVSAGWCVATCWAWTLLSFGAPHSHITTMAVVTVISVAERMPWSDPRRHRRLSWNRLRCLGRFLQPTQHA